ncbi:MAG TPA: hypothetical protein VFT55_14340, partial [Planctomycetota bacterium]|nr:hypothetical protein [Planctomycetota bacterium]
MIDPVEGFLRAKRFLIVNRASTRSSVPASSKSTSKQPAGSEALCHAGQRRELATGGSSRLEGLDPLSHAVAERHAERVLAVGQT